MSTESKTPSARLRLADGVEMLMSLGNIPLLYAPSRRKYFRLSSLAVEVTEILQNGPATTAESIALSLSDRYSEPLDHIKGKLKPFLTELVEQGVLISNAGEPHQLQLAGGPTRSKFPLLRCALWRPDGPVLQPLMKWIRTRVLLFTGAVVGLISILAVVTIITFTTKSVAGYANPQWFTLACLLTLHTALHEISHLLMASYFGVKIRELGVGLLYLFIPVAYVDRTDGYRLESRTQSACIALAGPAFDISAAGLSAIAGFWVTGAASATLSISFASQIFIFLATVNPLLPSDGYHAIEALAGQLNFRQRAFTILLRRITFRPLPSHVRHLTMKQELFYAVYAGLAVLFTSYLFWMFVKFVWAVFFAVKGHAL